MRIFKFIACELAGITMLIAGMAEAADLSYTRSHNSGDITISGEIKSGDYEKFIEITNKAFTETTAAYEYVMMQLKSNDPERLEEISSKTGKIGGASRVTVFLNSNGGSVTEAIKIGEAIHEMSLRTALPENSATCSSACFFIWVGGVERIAYVGNGKSTIGIHRIYFESSQYSNLSSDDAENKYHQAQSLAVAYLAEMGVPQELINKAISIPSNDVYYLSAEEIDSLDDYVPFLDELLTARCGNYSKDEWNDFLLCNIMYQEMDDGSFSYLEESKKKYIRKKCDAMSSGYKAYLEKTIDVIAQCRRMQSEIECWKRMANYLGYSHLIPE